MDLTSLGTRAGVILVTCTSLFVVNDSSQSQIKFFIDPGSEISLITNKLENQYRLQKTRSTLTITGIGALSTGPVLYGVAFTLQSRVSEFSLGISAFSLDQITNSLSSFELHRQNWDHLQGLQLANPDWSHGI